LFNKALQKWLAIWGKGWRFWLKFACRWYSRAAEETTMVPAICYEILLSRVTFEWHCCILECRYS
jgi:hypothetical protein